MILPYLAKLICLCLASFFLMHTALALSVWCAAPRAIRRAERLRASTAARLLLMLRLLPCALALVLVLGFGLPGYLLHEPAAPAERVGVACIAAAILGAALWGASVARAAMAAIGSCRFIRRCRRAGHVERLPGESVSFLVVEGHAPLVALAGIFRPRIVISQPVLRALSGAELEAALRHEGAHRAGRDNLKRLFLLLAPDLLPFSHTFTGLELAWKKVCEWAADDRAARGNDELSASLAEALVRTARLGFTPQPHPLLAPLVTGETELQLRVRRLLNPQTFRPEKRASALAIRATLLGVAGMVLAGVLIQPSAWKAAHQLLELLAH